MHRRSFRSLAGAAALALASVIALVTPASAAGGGLSGTVTDDSGAPVSTCVYAYDLDGNTVAGVCTDELGRWSMPDLAGGASYKVEVSGTESLLGEYYDDATDLAAATPVVAPAVVDSVLTRAAHVEGRLTDAEGAPLSWVSVELTDLEGTVLPNGWSFTSDEGSWSATLPSGPFKVHFTGWPVDQWAHQKTTAESADVFEAVAGATTRVDDSLIPVTHVTGHVTDAAGKALPGICASLVNPLDGPYNSVGQGCTDANGDYSLTPWDTVSGPLTMFFEDTNEPRVYAPEYAGDTLDPTAATPVDLSAGSVVVDARLAVGGVIVGKAVTERRPKGLPGVCPSLYLGRTGGPVYGAGGECSAADGTYRLTAVPPGQMTVHLQPEWRSGVAEQWYRGAASQATATLVTSTPGGTTTLRPEKFNPGGTVSGTVTDRAGRPVAEAWVYLEGRYPGRAGPGEGRYVAQTDASGRYSLVAPAGTYTPLVVPSDPNLAPAWSGGAVTRATAAPVTVRDFRSTRFDATLVPASHITGTMALGPFPDSSYVAGQVFTRTGDYIGDFDAWAENGFGIDANTLPAGDLLLRADVVDTDTGATTTVWYDRASGQATATPVHVGVGETAELTFHLG